MDDAPQNDERARWLLVALVATLALIYSTLGLAGRLAGELGDRAVLDDLFGAGLLLVGGVLVAMGVARSRRLVEAATVVAVGTVAMFTVLRIGIPEERTHLIEYAVVTLLLHELLVARGTRRPAATALVLGVAAGVADETIQAAIPSRVFDRRDILFNTIAAAMAVGGRVLVEQSRRIATRKSPDW